MARPLAGLQLRPGHVGKAGRPPRFEVRPHSFDFRPGIDLDRVNELNVECIVVTPPKAHAPLVVDPDAVLTRAFTRELLEPIAWRHPQVVEGFGRVEHDELP